MAHTSPRESFGNFELWLKEATEGLEAAEAILKRAELEEHYVEAILLQLEDVGQDPDAREWFLRAIEGLRPETRAPLRRAIEAHFDPAETNRLLKLCGSVQWAGSLESWIHTATKDLCGEAQKRVRAEVEGHYQESVREALERGDTEPEARASAMLGLGDPEAAAKRFRRRYLTKQESGWVRDQWFLTGWERWSWAAPFAYFMVMPCLQMSLRASVQGGNGWLLYALFAASATLGLFVQFRVAPSLFRDGHVRRAFFWRLMGINQFLAALLAGAFFTYAGPWPYRLAVFFMLWTVGGMIWCIHPFGFWRKVHEMEKLGIRIEDILRETTSEHSGRGPHVPV